VLWPHILSDEWTAAYRLFFSGAPGALQDSFPECEWRPVWGERCHASVRDRVRRYEEREVWSGGVRVAPIRSVWDAFPWEAFFYA
jgi:hypothetical protein